MKTPNSGKKLERGGSLLTERRRGRGNSRLIARGRLRSMETRDSLKRAEKGEGAFGGEKDTEGLTKK